MFAIDDIRDAHAAHRRRLMTKRRLAVLHAMIAALKRDREAMIEQQEALRGMRAAIEAPLNPLSDDERGVAWWNALTARQRKRWMRLAGDTGRARDAWETFKRNGERGECDA
jgi:hypothetical protein